jgi:hypothetical protein
MTCVEAACNSASLAPSVVGQSGPAKTSSLGSEARAAHLGMEHPALLQSTADDHHELGQVERGLNLLTTSAPQEPTPP